MVSKGGRRLLKAVACGAAAQAPRATGSRPEIELDANVGKYSFLPVFVMIVIVMLVIAVVYEIYKKVIELDTKVSTIYKNIRTDLRDIRSWIHQK